MVHVSTGLIFLTSLQAELFSCAQCMLVHHGNYFRAIPAGINGIDSQIVLQVIPESETGYLSEQVLSLALNEKRTKLFENMVA